MGIAVLEKCSITTYNYHTATATNIIVIDLKRDLCFFSEIFPLLIGFVSLLELLLELSLTSSTPLSTMLIIQYCLYFKFSSGLNLHS